MGPGSASRPTLRASLLRKSLADCRLRAAAAAVLGVTASDVLALQHLAWAGVLTPGGLASRLQLSSGGTSALVRRLHERGLVAGEPHPEDGRSTLLRLSSAGRDLAARQYALLVGELDAIIAALDPVERASVERFMVRVAEVTERHAAVLVRDTGPERDAIEGAPPPGLWA